MITLTWIVDDVASPPLLAEHGFAVWIETTKGRVLFDTGGSGPVLLHNLQQLGLDPGTIDAVVISHGHDDHTGGLPALAALLRPGVPMVANPTLFRPRYSKSSGELRSRGIALSQAELAEHLDIRLKADPQEVLPGVWTTGVIKDRPNPEGRSPYHFIQRQDNYVADPYEDDLSMVLEAEGGIFLFCGCCHAGLLNTISHVQRIWKQPIVGIAGGTHLKGASEATLQRTVAAVCALPSLRQVWLGHCSGEAFMMAMAQSLPSDVYQRGMAGRRLSMPGN